MKAAKLMKGQWPTRIEDSDKDQAQRIIGNC